LTTQNFVGVLLFFGIGGGQNFSQHAGAFGALFFLERLCAFFNQCLAERKNCFLIGIQASARQRAVLQMRLGTRSGNFLARKKKTMVLAYTETIVFFIWQKFDKKCVDAKTN
jgi:hypothetical protein